MKIFVDKLPVTYDECPFFSYEHDACIAYGGQYKCTYDKRTGEITEKCDWLIELPKGESDDGHLED